MRRLLWLHIQTLLALSEDSDADGFENQLEIDLPVNRLTLPWLEDSDADGVADGIDPCTNDPLNKCSSNPVLPVLTADGDITITEPFTGSNVALVGVRLDRIYDEAITVYYEVSVAAGNTATAGQDFTAMTGSVVIAAGQQSALVEVTIFADGDVEGSETFSFQITGADNAVVSGDGIVLLTLNDPGLALTIGGSVSGLGGNVVLQNNNGDNLSINANGNFSFSTAIAAGSSYSVSVFSQPVGQLCTVNYFSGTAITDVSDIEVSCSTSSNSYFIGGTVSGLTGTVILQNNSGDDLSLGANGSFTFATAIGDGLTYNVSVLTQPAGQTCTPTSNSGTVSGNNISTVEVSCTNLTLPDVPGNVTLSVNNPKTLTFSWDAATGANSYKLLKNPDGVSGYSEVFSAINALTVNDVIPVHIHDWVNATYIVQACNASGCTDSAVISTTSAMISAIGYFKASNTQSSDSFGQSLELSADGSTLAVGAWGEDSNATGINGDQSNNSASASGAVYIFILSGNNWIQQAYVKASNTEADDNFGRYLTLSADGNTLAVGAYGEDSGATGINGDQGNNTTTGWGSGAVYVFTRSAGTWSQQAYVKASNTEAYDAFGNSVSLSADGNTLAVGAWFEGSNALGINGDQNNNLAGYSGAVYVFTRSGSVWLQQAYIKASNTESGDYFGRKVALSADGDTLAVGASGEDSSAGAVYVFTRSTNVWSQQAYIKASNTEANDSFGNNLALSADGSTLAVTALNEASSATSIGGNQNDNTADYAGAVYVFTRSGNSWFQQAYIKAINTDAGDSFGSSISLSADGNVLAVGAQGEASIATGIGGNQNDNTADYAGAVYVFTRSSGSWLHRAYVKASNTARLDNFGSYSISLSADGNTLIVGAYGKSVYAGAFYVY